MSTVRDNRLAGPDPRRTPPARPAPAPTAGGPDLRARLAALQRLAGNQAVAGMLAGVDPTVLRLALQDGPPLAPGNYRYGNDIIGVDMKSMRKLLSDRAGATGLVAERKWQADLVADLGSVAGAQQHKYEDPIAKQTVAVEPTMATNAGQGQREIEDSTGAAQRQFQQDMLGLIGGMLDGSEAKLTDEAKRYGFPDHDSIFNAKPPSVGQGAIAGSLPASDEVRGAIRAAKVLLDGKHKLKAARDANAKLGPFLGPMVRPTSLEPAIRDYYGLRQKNLTEFPILASFERDDARLAEFAAGAQFAQPGSGGQAGTSAVLNAQDKIRIDIADKLTHIAVVRGGMKEQDKIEKFWADPTLVSSTKRKMALDPKGLPNAAVDDKVRELHEDAEFSAHVKAVIGTGLLLLSLVPGAGLVAGGIGLAMAANDLYGAFQDFYWEEAASGTAMDKAEAISQSDPSLFSLGAAIAFGILEGVAEAKALEGAAEIFKAVRSSYREARAAAAVAEAASGAARTAAAAELVTAQQKLRVATDQASGNPALGPRVLASVATDASAMAADLKKGLGTLTDPSLKELVIKDGARMVSDLTTLADEAAIDPARLQSDYTDWQAVERSGPKEQQGKRFDDWLRERRTSRPHGVVTDPAGLLEYGLDEAGARRSFDASIGEDPTREAGVWRDRATGEYVCVQGGNSFVDTDWMTHQDNMVGGRPRSWSLVEHYHPNRGIALDRLPSAEDFQHIAGGGSPRLPVQSTVVWTDPASKIRFESEFGATPGALRPFWTRYRVEDGTMRVASFPDAPWAAGATEYRAWSVSAFTDPAAAVPGGNVLPRPVPVVVPPVPGGGPRLLPPPRPTR